MREVANRIIALSNTTSSIQKLTILRDSANIPGFKEIMKFIFDPYAKNGISAAKLDKAESFGYSLQESIDYMAMIKYFKRHRTGSDSDLVKAATFIKGTDKDLQWLARAIVTQTLKIGVTATSLNKVYGSNFIPRTGCMLGKPFADVENKLQWPCIITEKLDGARRILIKEKGTITLYTRSGHEDNGLVDIIRDAALLPDNTAYDGELLAEGEFNDSIALRQATSSLSNGGGIKTGLYYNIFDMMPIDEFYAGVSKLNALNRKIRLAATFADQSVEYLMYEDRNAAEYIRAFRMEELPTHILPVPILGIANSLKSVEPVVDAIIRNGGEGVMLNTITGLYTVKSSRSNDLIKIKKIKEEVLEVVNFVEGNGKYEHMLGALVVKYKDNLVGVGSGFTDSQRQYIWDHRMDFLGKKIEIDTFGESTNALGQKSLNCPIFKRFKEV